MCHISFSCNSCFSLVIFAIIWLFLLFIGNSLTIRRWIWKGNYEKFHHYHYSAFFFWQYNYFKNLCFTVLSGSQQITVSMWYFVAGLFVVELVRYNEASGISAFFCKSKVMMVSFLVCRAILACRAYAKCMTSVCLSVCLSATLVDCDHTVRQKVEIGTWRDRTVSWLPACWSWPRL